MLFYSDNDSAFYSLPVDAISPILISTAFGAFKNIYGSAVIQSFHCTGQKQYAVTICLPCGLLETDIKCCGLNLQSRFNKSILTEERIHNFYLKLLEGIYAEVKIPQTRKRKREDVNINVTFNNQINIHRRLIKINNCSFTCVPYGYNGKLL